MKLAVNILLAAQSKGVVRIKELPKIKGAIDAVDSQIPEDKNGAKP